MPADTAAVSGQAAPVFNSVADAIAGHITFLAESAKKQLAQVDLDATEGPRANSPPQVKATLLAKDSALILHCMSLLVGRLPNNIQKFRDACIAIDEIVKNRKFEETSAIKESWQLYADVLLQKMEPPIALIHIADNFPATLGLSKDDDADADQTLPMADHVYKSITKKTANAVTHILLISVSKWLDCANYAITQLRGHLEILKAQRKTNQDAHSRLSDADNSTLDNVEADQKERERKVCVLLCTLSSVVGECCAAKFPETMQDAIIKCLKHMFDTLNLFTKYYAFIYQHKLGNFCPSFPKLVGSIPKMMDKAESLLHYWMRSANQRVGEQRTGSGGLRYARACRETKLYADMIRARELFLAELSILSRNISQPQLISRFKISMSRDFKMDVRKMVQLAENADVTVGSEAGNESGAPPAGAATPLGPHNTPSQTPSRVPKRKQEASQATTSAKKRKS